MSDTVIDQLVNYDGNDIWKDVILELSGYNESATFAVAGGRGCGMFVASNVIYEYDTGINNHGWITRGLYDGDDLEVLAANGVHNGPHNELVGAGRPTTRQLEDAMQAKNRATIAARTGQL